MPHNKNNPTYGEIEEYKLCYEHILKFEVADRVVACTSFMAGYNAKQSVSEAVLKEFAEKLLQRAADRSMLKYHQSKVGTAKATIDESSIIGIDYTDLLPDDKGDGWVSVENINNRISELKDMVNKIDDFYLHELYQYGIKTLEKMLPEPLTK